MSTFVTYRDGGKTNEEGLFKQLTRLFTKGNPINYNAASMQVVQRGAGANMSVDVSVGDVHLPLPSTNYSYWGWTDAATNVTISAADATNPRIDVIYAYVDLTVVSSSSNNNPGALKFGVSTGTPNATPVANSDSTIQTALGASTPFVKLATARVGNGVSNITTSAITDVRTTIQSLTTSAIATANTGWSPINFTASYAANNGNKEFTVTYPTDLTSTVSVGMKHQVTRTSTAPTQCMGFIAASSQYATNSSPSGITFTSAFTCEAWVYLNSYSSSDEGVITRFDGTNGFNFQVNLGQPQLFFGTSGSSRKFSTYQSIPLKRMTHIVVVVTVSTATANFYINGTLVPSVSTSGSGTVLTQGGPLQIGAINSTGFFDGYISEARLWSVAQSQSQIQGNMAISLTGSETNLVGLWQGNGNFNDKTSNANTLAANGGAIATQAANPFNNIEYGIVTKVSYSAPNTTLTIFTGTDYNIPNQALSSPQFSTARVPLGFPAARGKWVVTAITVQGFSTSGVSSIPTYYNTGQQQIAVPTGEWMLGYSASITGTCTTGNFILHATLSTNNTTQTDLDLHTSTGTQSSSQLEAQLYQRRPRTISSMQTWYLLLATNTGGGSATVYLNESNNVPAILEAECAYL